MFKFSAININRLPIHKVLIVVLTIISIVAITQCNMKNLKVTSSGLEIQMYKAQSSLFLTKVNQLGEVVNTQNTLIADRNHDLEKALLRNSELNRLNYQIKSATSAVISDRLVMYDENDSVGDLGCHLTDTSCVEIGTRFRESDKWTYISGSVLKAGIKIDSLSINDSIVYNLGLKRNSGFKGHFQQWVPMVEVIHSNPDVRTISLQNINLIDRRKWYEKQLTWGAFGLGLGVGVGVVGTVLLLK